MTGLPICLLSAVGGPLKLTSTESIVLSTKYIPWAIRCADKCGDLMSVHYECRLQESVVDLRRELNIEVAPKWTN